MFWTGNSLEQCGPLDRRICRGWAGLTAALTAGEYIPLTLSDDPTPLDTSGLHLLDDPSSTLMTRPYLGDPTPYLTLNAPQSNDVPRIAITSVTC